MNQKNTVALETAWNKNEYLCQVLSVSGINSVTETEVHTIEPLICEPSNMRFDISVENLQIFESRGITEHI
jgi:hypothetical protein